MSSYQNYPLFGRSILSLLFLATINTGIAQAQVIPDGTLPTLVEKLENMRKITGGERVGNNLFHSFEEFSVPAGMEAIFENALDLENIFTRITGNEISFIDGLLQTAGGANFFLVNPNGIVFGKNTRLDVGGSFVATTADTIEFADGTRFAARNPNVSLTISVPIGLGLYGNNGSITVNGSGNQIIFSPIPKPVQFGERPIGIFTPNEQTLALVSNGINFNGGLITIESGNVYLTSIESGLISLDDFNTPINGDIKYQNIHLNQESLIETSSERIGNIFVIGKDINILGGSYILARNQGNSSGNSLNIRATELLNMSARSPISNETSSIISETSSTGKGADINIYANQMRLDDGAQIRTYSFSDVQNTFGGNINIEVIDSIELSTPSSIIATTLAKGNAGNIKLFSSELRLDGTVITSSTFGEGNGGTLDINANLIEIIGVGNSPAERASIAATSFGSGSAKDVIINTGQLRILDGASLSSSSFGIGNAGNLVIKASESVEISGTNNNSSPNSNPQSIIRSAVQTVSPAGQKAFGLPAIPTGNAGDLTINTPLLNVSKEGVITVENQGTGRAGTLTIYANNLNLDQTASITAAAESGIGGNILLNTKNLNIINDSQISATAGGNEAGGNIIINTTNLTAKKNNQITASAFEGEGGNIKISAESLSLKNQDSIAATSELGNGGNINLNTDRLQVENNSNISASAGGEGNGGNITINGDTFTAFNSSRVTANAVRGIGGNITVNTTGYFVSDDFVISASSEFGLDGIIIINTPDNDLQKDLKLFNLNLPSLEEVIQGSCLEPNQPRGRFIIGGGGAFALSPEHYYSETDLRLDFEQSLQTSEEKPQPEYSYPTATKWKKGAPIIPAEKIVYTPDGRAFLVAAPQKVKDLVCRSN